MSTLTRVIKDSMTTDKLILVVSIETSIEWRNE
jgi:hypothetical protein